MTSVLCDAFDSQENGISCPTGGPEIKPNPEVRLSTQSYYMEPAKVPYRDGVVIPLDR